MKTIEINGIDAKAIEGRAKGQTLYPKLVKTTAMKTIEINGIDAKAIEELANNRVIDWHSARRDF